MTTATHAPDRLIFQVERIFHTNPTTGWCAVQATSVDVETGRRYNISGKFKAKTGQVYNATGWWKTHPTYGRQFETDQVTSVRIQTPFALARFLGMNVAGIGPMAVSALADELGPRLETVLDTADRDALVEVVGKKKADAILLAWPTIKPEADLISPLLGYGLTEAMADTLVKQLGGTALTFVEEDPYGLMLRVDGISFATADKIAMKVGKIGRQDPIRLRAALSSGMRLATSNGDVGVLRADLVKSTMLLVNPCEIDGNRRYLIEDAIDVPAAVLEATLDTMISASGDDRCGFSEQLVEFADDKGTMAVWYKPLVAAEKVIARGLRRFRAPARPDLVERIPVIARELGMTLAPEQEAAVRNALLFPVSVITGGPGVGKSATLKVLLAVLEEAGEVGYQVAPTGKAAKRITESTGRMASTIHTRFEIVPGRALPYSEKTPLPTDYIVFDEMSMADTETTATAVWGLPGKCRVILVGDVDQLASVGPGQVLRDVIRSECVPVTRLTRIFRQGAGSGIVTAAAAINSGKMPSTTEDKQFELVPTDTPAQDLLAAFKALVASGVKESDIQVLAPAHKGAAGCVSLNQALQAYLNPERHPGGTVLRLRRDSGDIRVGDRVIQNKNEAQLGLVNGDIGLLSEIDKDSGVIQLMLADRPHPIEVPADKSASLKLGYCITVHKSQGAEAPCVLIALDASTSRMLSRNLVYTAVTRGSQKVILFTAPDTLRRAVHKGEPPEGKRRTNLVSELREQFGLVCVGQDVPF